MKTRILTTLALLAVGVALADTVEWPADFWDQVAATHPAPSGTQVAQSAVVPVDARTSTALDAVTPLAVVEGRATSEGLSSDAWVDARRPSGLLIVVR